MKILVLTGLYPNSIQTRHGVFVEERLRSLLSTGEITARVIAPVPWFPFKHKRFGRYADFAAVPAREERHGIQIWHPRYLVVPRIGMTLGPSTMAKAVEPLIKRMLTENYDFDLIDAHYFYPDGVAAAKLAQRFHKPVVITARGADINKIPQFRMPRRQIMGAANRAAAIVTVSRALKSSLIELGVQAEKVTSLRNGVNLDRFVPLAQDIARTEIGCQPVNDDGRIWLAVGHLIERKGVHIAIEALAQASGATLLIAGTGPEESNLRNLASRCGAAERVRFLGHIEHDELPTYFSAADVLVLPTGSEGMPNVVLEAMACGTPVVATSVGGIPELLTVPEAGRLMTERTPDALMAAVTDLMQDYPDRHATRTHANRFSWEETTLGQLSLFRQILDR